MCKFGLVLFASFLFNSLLRIHMHHVYDTICCLTLFSISVEFVTHPKANADFKSLHIANYMT